jgi:uncharacterized membrane protein
MAVRSAPLPTVEDFAGYEEIHKGAAGEILHMASAAQKHRQWMEKWQLSLDFILKFSGSFFGALLMGGMLYLAYVAGMSDHNILAGLLLGSSGVSAVGVSFRHYVLNKNEPKPQPMPRPPKRRKG